MWLLETRQEQKKKNLDIGVICCILLVIAATIGCLIYFRLQVGKVKYLQTEKREYKNHYAFITSDNDSQFFRSVYNAAREEGEKRSDYVELMGENLSVDYSRDELMRIAIHAKVDGIIFEADENESTVELIEQAERASIPVITVGSDCTGSTRQGYVGISNYTLGQEYGRQMLAMESEDVQDVLVLMNTNTANSSQNIIYSGLCETIENSGKKEKFNIGTIAVDDSSPFGAEESVRNIFMREDELPDIMICLNELNTNCVYQAAVDYNKVGQIKIFGYYENDSIKDAISKRIITCTVSIDTEQMGKYCVRALDEYRETGYVNEFLQADIVLITVQNVGEFLKDEETEIGE